MKYCIKCGAELPDEALFCNMCGSPQPAVKQEPIENKQQVSKPESPKILTEMKCPNCGAPMNPVPGEGMIVCQYCGSSITLGSAGWSKIDKHYILDIKVPMQDQASAIARSFLDKSIFHRHLFEKSKLQKMTLSYIPYWILDSGYTAQYRYQEAESIPGNRGNQTYFVTKSGTDSGLVKFPLVAIESMNKYQPPEYIFNLNDKRDINARDLSGPIKMLNGNIGEEKAKVDGKIKLQQWESQKLKKKVHSLESVEINVEISDTYLVHIPVWYLEFEHKDKELVLLIDGHNAMVMEELKDIEK